MKNIKHKTITCNFTFLELGSFFRKSLGGAIYLKNLPVIDKYSGNLNCVNLVTNQLDFTFEDTDVFPVEETFVESYKE